MLLRLHFVVLARYHAWATRRLFDHVDALPEADYRRGAGLFFKSVHGTLNHLLVTDREIWFRRFAEGASPKMALDAELETDRTVLRDALLAATSRWEAWVAALPDLRLDERLDYVSTEGVPRSLPFATALAHVFNHGTHHRGQITAAITAMGHACPELDLAWMPQEAPR